ncbi:hypothetical protein DPMN_079994 [Dreissena polymorpha]|uniref:Uncharacterized protein n=1 Tax=Dreissena polymorpha TaxID=45954 RepID=A0A9D3YQ18_DREPO|nr:hypothetical protein DPMN_079994 [Dreissena polymorpha]
MNHWDRVIGINLLTKFHEDKTINVASRVLTRKKAPPPADRVFKPIKTILVLIQGIMRTNLLTTFHDDLTINVTSRVVTRKKAPPRWQLCFSTNQNHFRTRPGYHWHESSKFHEDQTIKFGLRVSTRFYYSHIWKNDPPPCGHFFHASVIIFKFVQDIIETNLLTKFHEDWTINVASRVNNENF